MRRKIPSTAALAAFEAAARHQSFTRAAEELSVTQSAVCRQIASLEDFVGVPLFRRGQRGVLLTEAGRRYARSVAARLDAVERDTLDLMAQAGQAAGGALELAVVPTFATQWLLPRLARFQAAHPGITLHFTPRTRPFLFDDESPFDAAIQPAESPWPGTQGLALLPEHLIAVASPALLQGRRVRSVADVAALPLLQASTRPDAWRQWFEAQGLQVEQAMAGARMELFSMLAEAAAQGLGAALVPRLLVENELASGRLQQLLPFALDSGRRYHLLYPPHKADLAPLQALADWLAQEAHAAQSATLSGSP
ncbi:LysR family transcriptional regulator [Ideonella sp. 4Y11]|uniref:LysR family transcriptional regulator n=1 Tax=Ideonella aquatica TaxID=2824119 RepID=A0A941BIW4_9BURK|nr:LysR substrate-binding domain-containing protein [Ideonella aquatica]MBQ0958977.1 LysR family transcriptional regulator [Ideonella aquatica]